MFQNGAMFETTRQWFRQYKFRFGNVYTQLRDRKKSMMKKITFMVSKHSLSSIFTKY